MTDHTILGYARADGRKGIRNIVVVVYLVECAHHVARRIADSFPVNDVHLIGFPGCYRNLYAQEILAGACTHPNVAAVLIVSLGCEAFDRDGLARRIEASGRPVRTLVIQENGGTLGSVEDGRAWIAETLPRVQAARAVPICPRDLTVAAICGGSDGASGITANPAIGNALDRLLAQGVTAIFDEIGELLGCEDRLVRRAATPALGERLRAAVAKAHQFYDSLGQASFAPGNATGGLTTIEEKSLGAYAKSGSAAIRGILVPGETPPEPGLYVVDTIPEGPPKFGFPALADTSEVVEFLAAGAQVTLFSTGRASVVGSAIIPVIKVCTNSRTFEAMRADMDIDAGRILSGESTIAEVGAEIDAMVWAVAGGAVTAAERLGHHEFVLNYKNTGLPRDRLCPGAGQP